ncbi:MAG: 30S ribosomal protein S5 [Candidatus Aenigmarchaeota archaeon]|nr:30S ribosomal protein S5 [Candidatus Aenigmarchaeota archaeon]
MRENTKVDITQTWIPKTGLGRKVLNGEVTSINEIFKNGDKIRESEIIDYLLPELKDEIIYLGGVPGKGGGKKRTPVRVTTRMHQSGRKRTLRAFVAVGNGNGLIGLGYASGLDARIAIEKAQKKAKLNIMTIRRGCGSWECSCKGSHSIPFKMSGNKGAVSVDLIPAPKGMGLVVANEAKKIMNLAGITDLWSKSRGPSQTRLNFIMAIMKAFEKLNKLKVLESDKEKVGLIEGLKQ